MHANWKQLTVDRNFFDFLSSLTLSVLQIAEYITEPRISHLFTIYQSIDKKKMEGKRTRKTNQQGKRQVDKSFIV